MVLKLALTDVERLNTSPCPAAPPRTCTALLRGTIGPMSSQGSPSIIRSGIGGSDFVAKFMMLKILAREHNRVAAELAKMHPAWNDDKLYSEVMHMVHVVVIVSYISTPRGTRIHFLLVSFRISSHPEFALQHLLIRLVQLSSPRCNTSLTGIVKLSSLSSWSMIICSRSS